MAAQRVFSSCLVFDPLNENKLVMSVFIVESSERAGKEILKLASSRIERQRSL